MKKDKLAGLLGERGKTHGDFGDVARVMQETLAVWQRAPNWAKLSDSQITSLQMQAMKQARILCGDPNEPDHWDDIAGYAVCGKGG